MERTGRRRSGMTVRDAFRSALEDLPEVRATEALASERDKRRRGERNECREEDDQNPLF